MVVVIFVLVLFIVFDFRRLSSLVFGLSSVVFRRRRRRRRGGAGRGRGRGRWWQRS